MNAAKVQITVSLVVYAATMAFALAQGWRANDLVWGIWISGVVVTLYAAAAVPLFQMTRRHADAENENWAIRAVQAIGNSFVNLGAFGLLGVPLLFGATGLMLNSFSPLLARSAFE